MAKKEPPQSELDRLARERPKRANTYDLLPEALRIYREGIGRGDLTGWPKLDEFFTVAAAQLTIVYGYPHSGKSQFVDALALNLARQGWKMVFCSLENMPARLHVEKLAMQYLGKPLREGRNARATEDELVEACTDMADWFEFISPSEEKPMPSLLDVVESVEESFKERGKWKNEEAKLACVIDPWNEIEHIRPRGMLLSEYIGESLSHLRQWSRQSGVHLFIVAHPSKQYADRQTGKRASLSPDMIADSAHFWNKADNILAVERDDDAAFPVTRIHVQKVRFAHIGHRGQIELTYDRVCGRYSQAQEVGKSFYTVPD